MLNFASADNNDIFSEVVCVMEINNHIAIDHSDVILIAKDGLSHHVVSIDIIINILHKSLFEIWIDRL